RAPAAYYDSDTLEVLRRIERDMGSHYRVNGRETRAKDVQLMFADMASGAHASSMVRQGQISQLISAKPAARRAILEEAAGISGLHARRHEAELKLNAAEANLARLGDVVQEIEGQLQGLKRQARQASRYRNISGQIRETEALALHLRWVQARDLTQQTNAALDEARAQAAELTRQAAETSTALLEAEDKLSPLRQAEVERAAALQRLNAERLSIDAEGARAREMAQSLAARLTQIAQDLARERALASDAAEQMARLKAEDLNLVAAGEGQEARLAALSDAQNEAQTGLTALETEADRLTAEAADLKARKAQLVRADQEAQGRLARLTRERDQAVAELAPLDAELARLPDVVAAAEAVATAEQRQAQAQIMLTAQEAHTQGLAQAERAARPPLDAAEREVQRLKAEAKALSALLSAGQSGLWPPVIDLIQVTPGAEAALGAAFGDDLDVPADVGAPVHWRHLETHDQQSLPPGVTPLSALVSAPPALARSLAQIGVVEPQDGARLQALLLPGQRLVSRAGDLWRWDGYVAAAEAPTPAAIRLQQRNHLATLEAQTAAAEEHAHGVRQAFHAARLTHEQGQGAEALARKAAREADTTLAAARQALGQAERARGQADMRRQSAFDRAQNLEGQCLDASRAAEAARIALADLPDLAPLDEQLHAQRLHIAEARTQVSDARASLETFRREAETRTRRRTAIQSELSTWDARGQNAQAQIATLEARQSETETERAQVLAIPGMVAERRQVLLSLITEADAARKEAADALALAETDAKAAASQSRRLDQSLSEARETRARAEVQLENARERLADIIATAREVMDCEPEALLARADWRAGDPLPPLAQTEAKVEKLKREREQLGGVNLRADEEAQECETRLTTLLNERTDLESAIAKLRGAISALNREGRERLTGAFDTVNENFQKLFKTLFQGGEAHLLLADHEDPLQAGLDIIARPPGKKPASLSLLSGGEQALTALALIFAVFLVNPAPICVLDEVDAPLDDANVERFCNLLDEMTRTTTTRFLIITHHALTMSRMNRLIGVTMQERGVSSLVSVDLAAYGVQPAAQAAE
ncbi:MAG TPA: chromosome segregation protein SMC, partial [Alphaproteobacteria bacterium]|nr:chromosome segregation protein SMC [Alphaproteobacteria bacterium]